MGTKSQPLNQPAWGALQGLPPDHVRCSVRSTAPRASKDLRAPDARRTPCRSFLRPLPPPRPGRRVSPRWEGLVPGAARARWRAAGVRHIARCRDGRRWYRRHPRQPVPARPPSCQRGHQGVRHALRTITAPEPSPHTPLLTSLMTLGTIRKCQIIVFNLCTF